MQISLRPKGSEVLGTRTEMKNLNSISNVKASIEYEIKRQAKLLDTGESVTQKLVIGMLQRIQAFL